MRDAAVKSRELRDSDASVVDCSACEVVSTTTVEPLVTSYDSVYSYVVILLESVISGDGNRVSDTSSEVSCLTVVGCEWVTEMIVDVKSCETPSCVSAVLSLGAVVITTSGVDSRSTVCFDSVVKPSETVLSVTADGSIVKVPASKCSVVGRSDSIVNSTNLVVR